MKRAIVATAEAPKAIGPYSQAVAAGGFLFLSGQIALDPASGELVADGDVAGQTRRCLENLCGVLRARGLGPSSVVKTTIFLVEMGDFQTVNGIYGEFFGETLPARATVAVKALPRGARVEIEAVAVDSGSD